MIGISVDNTRQLYVQAVLDGQLSEQYVTIKELTFIYRELWEKMIDAHLPQSAPLLH